MAAARLDEHRHHRLEREGAAIQLDTAFSFQHEVNLRHFLVIVRSRILLNVHHVHRGDPVFGGGKGSSRKAARALHGSKFVETRDHVIGRYWTHGLTLFIRITIELYRWVLER